MVRLKLNDFDTYATVYEDYSLQRRSLCVEDAVAETLRMYAEEMVDEAPLVWVGIAKAQIRRKELTNQAALRAEESIPALIEDMAFPPSCFATLRRQLADPKYRADPQKLRQPPKPRARRAFHIPWNIGDVYAFTLRSDFAKDAGIDGWRALLFMVDRWTDWPSEGGRTEPLVYVSLWNRPQLPQSMEEIRQAGFLTLSTRVWLLNQYHPGKKTYRLMIDFPSKKSLERFSFEFVGNFPVFAPLEDEIVIAQSEDVYEPVTPDFTSDVQLEKDICQSYKRHGLTTAARRD